MRRVSPAHPRLTTSIAIVAASASLACGSPQTAPRAAPAASTSSASNDGADAGARGARCDGDDFGLPKDVEPEVAKRFAAKVGTSGRATKRIVSSSHRLATEAGLSILRAGGNAADAFVATVLAQDVVLPGVTSTAGLTGVLVYEARTKKITYVHGGVADPIEPARRYANGDAAAGKWVLVPGAPAAYAEIVKRFGRKPLSAVVEPAAKLATDGFPADALYARSIAGNKDKLERSAYGRKAFFADGVPVAAGGVLVLAELGATLRSFGKDPSYFYKGAWAKKAVALANDNGGSLTTADFATYAPEIASPIHARFMGNDVYAAGHGGVKVLVSLQAYEIARGGAAAVPPSASADAIERLIRVQRAVHAMPLLRQRDLVKRGTSLEETLAAAASEIAARVREESVPPPPPSRESGTHSSAAIVVDDEGNIVVGTHTIETINWGEGLFVDGVPLSTAGPMSFDDPRTATDRMRIDPLSSTLVMRDGAPIAALTVYGTGLHPADVQILDAVLARGLDAESAVLEPRVGFFAFDLQQMKLEVDKNSADPRIPAELLCEMKARGLHLERRSGGLPPGLVDTGFPTLVTIAPGRLHGMTPDMPHINGVTAGD